MCIEKWLTSHPKCPQCNGPAKKADVRPIYAKKISAVDEEKMEDAMRLFEVCLINFAIGVGCPVFGLVTYLYLG